MTSSTTIPSRSTSTSPTKRLTSLNYVLATNGFFTKKTRPIAEKASRKVLARFKNATLTSKHPT